MDEITRSITEAFPGDTNFVVLTAKDFDLIKSHIHPEAVSYYRLDEINLVPLENDEY